ncbi:MAG TPA: acyl-CoA dehydrogenase family protein, partial [Acidimicrobiales bacterium]|nr:acyl-CoA dehydrogenase family protein [Acidimicrobiales bacterium]
MEIGLSDDQELFRETTRRALDERSPISRVRELIDDPLGFDRAFWVQGAELGWYSMLIPEEYGGGTVSGEGLVDLTIVAEELGRAVHPGPFHTTN